MALTTTYSDTPGTTQNWSVSLDNTRRKYAFGDRVAELTFAESPFFFYMSRLMKEPVNDPVFKNLEERKQWQRRNFEVHTDKTGVSVADPITITDLRLTVDYDKFGREVSADTTPVFFVLHQMLAIECEIDTGPGGTYEKVILHGRIEVMDADGADYAQVHLEVKAINNDTDYATTYSGKTIQLLDGHRGQVVGSQHVEAGTPPDGWRDELYDREGICQIFKDSVPLMSGTEMATEYRGRKNEWVRVWGSAMKAHNMDVVHAMLFQVGYYVDKDDRATHGFIPYVSKYGITWTFSYGASGYNEFIDFLEYFMAPERGNSGVKMVATSRKVIGWMSKLGDEGFLKNTVGAQALQLNVNTITNRFGHKVLIIDGVFGTLVFFQETLLRGLYEDFALVIDTRNLKYRPLAGNGISRDTFVETNVQTPGTDGRKDQIITEAGLGVDLPETHAVLQFQ